MIQKASDNYFIDKVIIKINVELGLLTNFYILGL